VVWGRRRLDPTSLRGFWLTFTIAVGALAAWAFGGLTQDVVGHDEAALADPHVTAWVVAHRTEWLTGVMKVATWLGSTAIIIPVGLIVGIFVVLRRRDWRPGVTRNDDRRSRGSIRAAADKKTLSNRRSFGRPAFLDSTLM
jgi:hypothetical protein